MSDQINPGTDTMIINCESCPNYGGDIQICLFDCLRDEDEMLKDTLGVNVHKLFEARDKLILEIAKMFRIVNFIDWVKEKRRLRK